MLVLIIALERKLFCHVVIIADLTIIINVPTTTYINIFFILIVTCFQGHLEKAASLKSRDENRSERIQTMKSVVKYRTDAEYSRKELAIDLSEALIAANIPVEKLNHPALRQFLERRIPGAGSIPSAEGIRQWYLPTVRIAIDRDVFK